MTDARAKVVDAIGTAWCNVYEPDNMRTEWAEAAIRAAIAHVTGEAS